MLSIHDLIYILETNPDRSDCLPFHEISEILLKVALNTINLKPYLLYTL
jgi:hypothetical protein